MGETAVQRTIQCILGENVRRLRERRGWTQDQLAEVSGLHYTYVSGIERGRRNVTIDVLARMADALRVRPTELLRELPQSPAR